jgi:hypothetical protein
MAPRGIRLARFKVGDVIRGIRVKNGTYALRASKPITLVGLR